MNKTAIALHITGAGMTQNGVINGAYEIPATQTSYPGWETFIAGQLVTRLGLTHGTIIFVEGFHVSEFRLVEKLTCPVSVKLKPDQSPTNGSSSSASEAAAVLASGMPGPVLGVSNPLPATVP